MSYSPNTNERSGSNRQDWEAELIKISEQQDRFKRPPLTKHEAEVKRLIIDYLYGNIQGFPDNELKLENVVRAWAKFMSLEPYHVAFDPQVEPYMTEEDKAPYLRKEGIIPGLWLLETVRDSFDWMPTPVVARELYCNAGFPPLDGLTMDKLPAVALARRAKQEGWE